MAPAADERLERDLVPKRLERVEDIITPRSGRWPRRASVALQVFIIQLPSHMQFDVSNEQRSGMPKDLWADRAPQSHFHQKAKQGLQRKLIDLYIGIARRRKTDGDRAPRGRRLKKHATSCGDPLYQERHQKGVLLTIAAPSVWTRISSSSSLSPLQISATLSLFGHRTSKGIEEQMCKDP